MNNQEHKRIIGNLTPDFALNPVIESNKYGLVKQDSVINGFNLVSSKTNTEIEKLTNKGLIRTKNGDTDLTVIIKEYGKVQLKASTTKLLTLFNMEFTNKGCSNTNIAIPLKELAELLGKKDLKTLRASVNEDLEALANIELKAEITNHKKERDYIDLKLIQKKGISKGVVFMEFTNDIANHLKKCPIMPMPMELFTINSHKNPYSYYLGYKIYYQMRMNQWDKASKEKKDHCIISVEKLLNICMENGLPSYEKVSQLNRAVEQKIIEPFTRDLDALQDLHLFKWEFCNAKGEPLTDEELDNKAYKDFIRRYVRIEYPNSYLIADFDKKKAEKKEKAKKKNKRKAKKNED